MTPDYLRTIGPALYGGWGWQTAMARDLGVNSRTVRHWVAGDNAVPPGAVRDLSRIARARARELRAEADELDALAATAAGSAA